MKVYRHFTARFTQTCLIFTLCICLFLSGCNMSGGEQGQSDFKLDGTSWTSGDDNSFLIFGKDQSFAWYQSKDVQDDNYFKGTYEVYVGEDAMKYLTEDLSDYNITKEEIEQIFSQNAEYDASNLICLTLNHQSYLLNGEEQLAEAKDNSYFGFILQDGNYLDIANMTTGSYYGFTKE